MGTGGFLPLGTMNDFNKWQGNSSRHCYYNSLKNHKSQPHCSAGESKVIIHQADVEILHRTLKNFDQQLAVDGNVEGSLK